MGRHTTVTLVAGVVLLLAACSDYEPTPDPSEPAEVVSEDTAPEGWKTIRYQDVLVSIPAAWEHTDMTTCAGKFEHWGPQPADCGFGVGVGLYPASMNETQEGPGVRRADQTGRAAANGVAFTGYVMAGDWAVWVADPERDTASDVLALVED